MPEIATRDALEDLAASLARARGDHFFPVLAEHLAKVLDASEVLIAETAAHRRARTLAVWRAGSLSANYEYDLEGTPCAAIRGGEPLLTQLDASAFPGAPQKYRGYFGMALAANDGALLGHLCAYGEHAFSPTAGQRALCDILASRAAAELRLIHVKRERALLRAQRRQLRAEIAADHDVDEMRGTSVAHARTMDDIRRAALSGASVLIKGEPGTGKELVARAIHTASARAAKPFVKIDCSSLDIDAVIASLPQTLMLASGGTLFLDEIGVLPTDVQARLLAALPAPASEPGASGNVRVISATNRDLPRKTRDGEFLTELLDRLSILSIEVPPLRARVEDIPLLVQGVLRKQARRLGRRADAVDPESIAALDAYAWPGNVRELVSLVERSLVMQEGALLRMSTDLLGTTPNTERAALIAVARDSTSTVRTTLLEPLDFDDTLSTGLHVVQRDHILRVLHSTRWVIEGNHGAALKLGLKPATLRHRMKKLGIARAAKVHEVTGTQDETTAS